MSHKIVLGSTSKHKISAIEQACKEIGLTAEVLGVKTGSIVNEQPVGYEETFAGAIFRAMEAGRQSAEDCIVVGIESGILRSGSSDNPSTVDFATVVMVPPGKDPIISTSAGLQFPEDCVKEAEKRGFETTTVGSVISEKLGGDGTDPHNTLTNGKVSRTKLLVDAIKIALLQLPE